ncbi:MAG: ComEC/Rec2 family competence protein [Verrucomicrobiota bacterium]|jgi:ComEC/Rec2-related protein
MQRPLAAVVVAYGTGLLLAQWLHPPLLLVPALAFVLVLVVALSLARVFKQRRWAVWPLLALLGWLNFNVRTDILSPADLRVLVGREPAMVTLRGTLVETPRLKIIQRDDQEKWRSVARVKVRQLRRGDAFEPAAGEVQVATPDVLGPDFFGGQPVEISGVLAPPPSPLAGGLFDCRQYLATRGIYYQLKTDSTNDWKLLEPHRSVAPLTDRFLDWSRQTLALGLPAEDEPLRLLWAMTLGWRTAFTGDLADAFLQAGTQHMFAIDGLRIALVSGLIVGLLRLVRLSRAWCGLVAVPVIWFYTAATGWEASAIRASVMMTVVLGGWALKRPGDLLNSLAAAAGIILLADPRQLFQTGFLLSFCVMLVIAITLPPLNGGCDRLIDRLLKPDPLLPDELVPGWRKELLSRSRRVAHFGALSFAAWLGCLPLAAKFFHLFSPVSTLANLFAVPLGALALTANLAALICGHWLPWCTVLFNHAAWFLMAAMTWVSLQSARLPGAFFYVPEPSLLTIVLYYAVVAGAFSGWFRITRRKIAGCLILLLVGAGYLWHWQSSRAETDLTVLPLSGGHAVYVDADGRRNDWLINCGSEDAIDFTMKDFLRAQGVNRLPRLVLADGSARNCGGARRIDELFGVGELWTSAATVRSAAYRAAVAGFESRAAPPGEPAHGGQRTDHQILNSGETHGCWQVLFPAITGSVSRAGDAALVLRGNFHGTSILLLSELSRTGQSELLAQTNDLRADLVIAGLPDEGEPLCDALIAASQPRVIVIADSEYPASRRASRLLKERLERTKIPVFYTRTAGAVKIVAGPPGWRLQTMDGQNVAENSMGITN